ncbi:MAG: hypothetical protein JWL99_5676 [Streptomyces oryziradicis]|nr:hypothetical protein [Actinacidiphila oryziradicis]
MCMSMTLVRTKSRLSRWPSQEPGLMAAERQHLEQPGVNPHPS